MPYQLAVHLRAAILRRDPETKVPDETPAALERWAIEADRMVRCDNRDPQEAARLMAWAQQDSFWHTNILSMAKFRKQYDTLKRQAQQARADPRASPIDTEPPVITDAELKRLEWMAQARQQQREAGTDGDGSDSTATATMAR